MVAPQNPIWIGNATQMNMAAQNNRLRLQKWAVESVGWEQLEEALGRELAPAQVRLRIG